MKKLTRLQRLYKEYKTAEMRYRAHLAEVQFSRGDIKVSQVQETYVNPFFRRSHTRKRIVID